MSRDLADLEEGFRADVDLLLERCRERGVEMVPYCTIRTPAEQARLWRQSRPGSVVRAKIAELKETAPFLARVLEGVGPRNGPRVTNALPGLGWHQWGEAVDCSWLADGDSDWDENRLGDQNGLRIYRKTAIELGLSIGPSWDWPHIQRVAGGVRRHRSMEEINSEMMKRFG